MHRQNQQFGLSPARLVWLDAQHSAAAPNLESLITEAGKEAKKGLTEAEQKALDAALKDLSEKQGEKRSTVIHWSVRERARFAQELSASIAANQNIVDVGVQRASTALGIDLDARARDLASKVGVTLETGSVKKVATISNAIQREIEHELHQTAVDAAAKNYIDADNSPAEKDANSTRQIIDDAYRAAAKTLDTKQRTDLSAFVQAQAATAYETNKEGQPSFFLKKKVDYREANAIADAIKQKAEEIKQGITSKEAPAVAVRNQAAETRSEDAVKKQQTAETSLHNNKPVIPEWATKDLKIDPTVKKSFDEPPKTDTEKATAANVKKSFEQLQSWGCNITETQGQEALLKILSGHYKDTGMLSSGLSMISGETPTKKFGTEIVNGLNSLTEFISSKYPNPVDQKKVFEKFLELKDLKNADANKLVSYLAFSNVSQDIRSLDEYFEAHNKIKPGEKVNIDQNIKSEDIAAKAGKEGHDGYVSNFDAGLKTAKKLWDKGDRWGAVVAFFKALFGMSSSVGDIAGKFATEAGLSKEDIAGAAELGIPGATWLKGAIDGREQKITAVGNGLHTPELGFTTTEAQALGGTKMTLKEVLAFNPNANNDKEYKGIRKQPIVNLQARLNASGIDMKDHTSEPVIEFLVKNQPKIFPAQTQAPTQVAAVPATAPVAPAPAPAAQPPAKPAAASASAPETIPKTG